MNSKILIFTFTFILLFFGRHAFADSPIFLPFQAQLTDIADVPITGGSHTVDIKIIGPGSCTLYQESFSGVVPDGKGMVALSIGTGGVPSVATPLGSFQNIWENNGIAVTACVGGGTTTLTGGSPRYISFNVDSAGYSSNVNIGSVMYAWHATNASTADNALKIAGRSVSAAGPAASDVLTWNGSQWAPAVSAAGMNQLTGDVTAGPGSGSQAATVANVGGVTAANVASGANLANAATNANTASTIVMRDASGNFTAGTITATTFVGAFSGNATNVTGTVAVANGGTGAASLSAGQLLVGNGVGAVTTQAFGSANVNNNIVQRDGLGNFAASNITATTFTGNLSGNATNVTGIVAVANGGTGLSSAGTNGQVLTVVSGNPAWSAPAGDSSKVPLSGGTMTGDLIVNTKIGINGPASEKFVVTDGNILLATSGSTAGKLILQEDSGGTEKLSIKANGAMPANYTLTFPSSAPAANQILQSDASGNFSWINTPSGGGIATLNGLGGGAQTLVVGSSGTDFNIDSTGAIHTFNIPSASASNRGLLASGDWSNFNSKLNSSGNITLNNGNFSLTNSSVPSEIQLFEVSGPNYAVLRAPSAALATDPVFTFNAGIVAATDVVTKNDLTTNLGNYVNKASDTMTGALTMSGANIVMNGGDIVLDSSPRTRRFMGTLSTGALTNGGASIIELQNSSDQSNTAALAAIITGAPGNQRAAISAVNTSSNSQTVAGVFETQNVGAALRIVGNGASATGSLLNIETINSSSASPLRVSIGGVDRLMIQNSGHLKLISSGGSGSTELQANSTGNHIFRFPDSAGNPNDVLKTDGSGNLSWESPNSTFNHGSVASTAGTVTLDFSNGRTQIMEVTGISCGTLAFNLTNMISGGTYVFIIKNSTTGTGCPFNTFSGTGLTIRGQTTPTWSNIPIGGSYGVVTIRRINSDVFISQESINL